VVPEHTDAMTCSVVPTPQSFCTLHFLHTLPSFQKPDTHPHVPQPTPVHVELSGLRVGSHAAHTVLLPTVHGWICCSPTPHDLHAVHLESDTPVHAVRNVDPGTHDRWVHATHRSPDR
jgi:hypothetical protein